MSSVAIGSFLGSLLGFLAAKGISDFELKNSSSGSSTTTQIFGKQAGSNTRTLITTVTQNTITEEAPFVNVFEYVTRITTDKLSSVDPNNPDLEILNPFNADCVLMEIDFGMDSNFQAKGGLAAQINQTPLVTDSRKDNPFVDAGGLTLDCKPKGQEFAKADKLGIWITSTDGTTVALTVTATFGLVDNG